MISASCHSDEEFFKAQEVADIALISPKNKNHYSSKKLISDKKFSFYSDKNLVSYALSGMQKKDIAYIQSLGGQGIAGISAFK